MNVQFTRLAETQMDALDTVIRKRVTKKLYWFAAQGDPLRFAERLTGQYAGLWRFRIGDYRVFFEVINGTIRILRVLSVKHRSEAYRGN